MNTLAMVQTATALAILTIVGFELRDPLFRADSFAAGPRRRRNWAYLAFSFLPTRVVQSVASWLHGHLPTLIRPGSLPAELDFLACLLVA